eukprot:Tamp_07630.p1 GENE.Tamp_07630~~Tamp_07630.p1  ORF type:complete len:439 (+),score=64.93 Tamp_07630:70-1386(+)
MSSAVADGARSFAMGLGAGLGVSLGAAAGLYWYTLQQRGQHPGKATSEQRAPTFPRECSEGEGEGEGECKGETGGQCVEEDEFFNWSGHARLDKAGVIQDLRLKTTLPYMMSADYQRERHTQLHTALIYRSKAMTETINHVLHSREVGGLQGIKFADVVQLVLDKGASRIYVGGGFIRDLLSGVVGDDLDFLFRCTGGSVVPFLLACACGRGWPTQRKFDEVTQRPRWDYITIGTDAARSNKFSGHPIGANCEGDFACNTLLYDIASGSLIDPTGQGVRDAINFVLRVPVDRLDWEEWLLNDRLPGMKLLRYFNFVSRGFQPVDSQTREFMVTQTMLLFAREGLVAPNLHGFTPEKTLHVFVKRKIFKASYNVDEAQSKEAAFRGAVVSEFERFHACSKSSGATLKADAFYRENFQPVYRTVDTAGARAWHERQTTNG